VDIIEILKGNPKSTMDASVFYKIRLPRTFLVVLSGGALALAGTVYQMLFKNPLVSPDVLGVDKGCSVGAILAILYGGGSMAALSASSFLFGLLTVCLALLLSRFMRGNSIYSMVIAGIVIASLANSIIMLLKYTADPNRELPVIEYWLMGSFNNGNMKQLQTISPMIFAATFIIYLLRWKLKVLTMGDEEAKSLGISVGMLRAIAILCATMLVSAVVSVAGTISWIGLIIPHLVRVIGGEDFVENFSLSLLCGGIFLLIADILARTLFTAEIPIGILTSFIGAGFLVLFLCNKKFRSV